MKLLTHIQPLTDAITPVRRGAADFNSNFFANNQQVESWIGRSALFYESGPLGVLVFRRDREFYRVYHVAANPEALSKQLASLDQIPQLRGRVLVSDLVGRTEDICTAVNLYREHGFREYTCLFRMVRLSDTGDAVGSQDPEVIFAAEADVPAIVEFLEQMLDPFVDQIPGASDFRTAAARGNILIVRRSGILAGLLIFERTGLTTVLRYWYVGRHFQGQGIGARLIGTFFRLCRDGKRNVLWVVGGNADGIAKYRHYGFRQEQIEDRIMIRDMTRDS